MTETETVSEYVRRRQEAFVQTMQTLVLTTLPRLAWDEVIAQVELTRDELVAHPLIDLPDANSRSHVTTASLVLAFYRVLWRMSQDRMLAQRLVHQGWQDPTRRDIKNFINDRFGITQANPEEAFERVALTFKDVGQRRFGGRFEYVEDVRTRHQVHVSIRRCLFNDYMRTNGAPELITVFCGSDMIWAEELQGPRYGVEFSRPTLLSFGDDACRFHFNRSRCQSDGEA